MIPAIHGILAGGGGSNLAAAVGLWVTSDYVSSPRKAIPNRNTAVPVRNNLLNYSRGAFKAYGTARLEWGVGASVTLTEGQTGPDGLAQATRMQVTANAGTTNGRIFEGYALAAGSYVQTIWMKSNTGSDQTVAFGDLYTDTTNFTVTPSWQCFQRAFTFASASTLAAIVRPHHATTHDAIDILICDAECFPAGDSAIGTYAVPAGHLYLGISQADTGITVTGGVLDTVTSGAVAVALADFAPSTARRTRTVMVIAKQESNTDSSYQQLWGNADSMPYTAGLRKSALLQDDSSSAATGCMQLWTEGADSVRPTGRGMLDLYGAGYHGLGYTTGGDSGDASLRAAFYLDDVTFAYQSHLDNENPFNKAERDYQRWQIGHPVGAVGRHKIAAVAMWDRELSASEYRAAYAELVAVCGVTVTPPSRIVMVEGDSISSDIGSSEGYPRLYRANQTVPAYVITRSQSGSTLAAAQANPTKVMTNRAAELDTAFPSRSVTRILSILIGANCLKNAASAAAWLADLESYVASRRAAGWLVAVGTLLPQGTSVTGYATHNSRRVTVNDALRTWVGAGKCDALIDYAADATMGPDAAANNASLYGDGMHPTAAGQVILEAIYRPQVDAM